MRTTITLFLMVFIKVSFGQCDTPIPTSAYTDTSLCQSWIECSRILWAESEDTLIWYKIDGADTAEVDRNRRGYSAPETSEPGFYKYAVSAKGECESKKLPLNVTILPYTPIEITEEVSINYYDTIAEVKALPPGGNFYVYESDPSIVILYSLACEMEGTPSQGEDSIFEVNITTFTPGWNHYYNYSYFNEYGCGSSTTKDINVLPPPRPNNPDTLVYMFSETNVSIVANSAPSCEIVWSYNSSPYNIIYIGDTLLLDQFLFWTNRIYAFQKFGEQYSEPKETVLIGVDCYAKTPKVESVIIEVPLGDTYPTISPTLTAEFETIHFFDYNQFQQGITVDLSTTNTYTPTKSEEICVIALDDRYGCYSPCQLVSVRTICNNVNTPIIDSIIQDTLYDEYENATIVVQNTREANQTCIWYIDDNLYVDEIADTLKYSFNKAITEVYVSIVDTVQKCQSESSNFIYKKINCDVDFTYPSMPTAYFGDTIPTLEMIAPGQHINWYLNYDSLVETGPS